MILPYSLMAAGGSSANEKTAYCRLRLWLVIMTSELSSVNESTSPGTMQTRHHSGTVACHKAIASVAMCTMGRADVFSPGGQIMIPSRSETILKNSRGDIMLVERSVS